MYTQTSPVLSQLALKIQHLCQTRCYGGSPSTCRVLRSQYLRLPIYTQSLSFYFNILLLSCFLSLLTFQNPLYSHPQNLYSQLSHSQLYLHRQTFIIQPTLSSTQSLNMIYPLTHTLKFFIQVPSLLFYAPALQLQCPHFHSQNLFATLLPPKTQKELLDIRREHFLASQTHTSPHARNGRRHQKPHSY